MIEENEEGDDHWSLCVLPMKFSAAKDSKIRIAMILQWFVVPRNYVY